MKKTKYNNKKVEFQGIQFDSAIEARYYGYLSDLIELGIVKKIVLQPEFVLQEAFEKNGKKYRAITYSADFEVHYSDRVEIVDVKGFTTQQFEIKKKMFEYRYEHELRLVTYSKIDGGWITLDELKKARTARKKRKQG